MVSVYLDKISHKWRLGYSYKNKKKSKKKWFYLSKKEFPELYYEEYYLNKWEFIRKVKKKYIKLYISKLDWDKIFKKLEKSNIKLDINKSGLFGEVHRLKWDIRDIKDSINKLKEKYPKRKNRDYYNLLRKEVNSIKI